MNRRGFLTGLASLVVPVPASVKAQMIINCRGRVGGVRAGLALLGGRWVSVIPMPDGTWLAEGSIADCVITGTVTV